METLRTYLIDLKNLSSATTYKFDYKLGSDFFKCVDGPEVKEGDLNVALSVVRASNAFELDFHIKGTVDVLCDRCLDDMNLPIETDNRLIVTFGETYSELSDEHIVVPEEEGTINVAWYMYEFIALAIPMKHVHEQGKCNEKMAAKLRELCVEDSAFVDDDGGVEAASEGKQPVDPRWEALRNLMGDN